MTPELRGARVNVAAFSACFAEHYVVPSTAIRATGVIETRLSLGILGIAGSLLVFTSPASAAILARCGTSSGQAFYEDAGTWTPDKIGKGGFEFVVDDKGSPNVHFVDTTGGLVDAAADGAKVTFSFIHHELGEFGIVVIYEATGVVETYNVIKTSTKSKVLYWTANRSMASQFSKVSAMVAQCSP